MISMRCFSCQETGHSYRQCRKKPMNQQRY
jgi:hypothetical protein